jgi:broad specificity phosphatase PhoE
MIAKYLKITCIVCFSILSAAEATSAETIYYLVRHSEKQSDGTRDPSLTTDGLLRANNVAAFLRDKSVTAIYSSDYKRTQETAAPTAALFMLPVRTYDPSALKAFADNLKNQTGRVLVVGHSNTTPVLANLLAGTSHPDLEEHQYDYLYIVRKSDDGVFDVKVICTEPCSR